MSDGVTPLPNASVFFDGEIGNDRLFSGHAPVQVGVDGIFFASINWYDYQIDPSDRGQVKVKGSIGVLIESSLTVYSDSIRTELRKPILRSKRY